MPFLADDQKTELGSDLQSFVAFLEKFYPDEVLRVSREVDPFYEATAVLWALENQRRYPLVVFV
jgi:3-polyprenyl-4-hydroxybenzoate decarboxylase